MTLSYPKYNKMMKLFGKVASETETTSSIDNEDCIEDCRNAPDCILAFMTSMGYCKLYNYSTTLILTVEELSGDQGLYVAFKVGFYQEIDACPASYNSKTFMLMIGEEAVRWTRTQTGWVINNCPEPWKMFSRNDSIKVCMRFFHTSDHATTRQEAIETCESQGFKLTGLTAEEVEYWKPVLGNDIAWIDGIRNTNCWKEEKECYARVEEENCQMFSYTDGYTPMGPPVPTDDECMRSIYSNPDCQVIRMWSGIIHINCLQDNFASATMCGFKMN